jgi:NHL repeat
MKSPKLIHYPISVLALPSLMASQILAQSTYQPYAFTTLAGGAGFVSAGTPGSALRFNILSGVRVDQADNLLATDTFNHVIRKVTPMGQITTLAGLPGVPGNGDGRGSASRFSFPFHLGLDSAGNAYVTQDVNTIRKVTPDGVVTTIAGRTETPGSADGIGSVARFNLPTGVAVDSADNIYVCDAGNHTIRKLTLIGSDWMVTTIAGLAGSSGAANGTNRAARFNFPQGLDIDAAGNLYVADTDNSTLRKVVPVGTNWVVTTLAGRAGSLGSVAGRTAPRGSTALPAWSWMLPPTFMWPIPSTTPSARWRRLGRTGW